MKSLVGKAEKNVTYIVPSDNAWSLLVGRIRRSLRPICNEGVLLPSLSGIFGLFQYFYFTCHIFASTCHWWSYQELVLCSLWVESLYLLMCFLLYFYIKSFFLFFKKVIVNNFGISNQFNIKQIIYIIHFYSFIMHLITLLC